MKLETIKKVPCIVCNNTQRFLFTYHKYFNYYQCPLCGLVSTYPLPTTKMIKEHYKKKFKKGNYQLLFEYSNQYKQVYENFAAELERVLTDKKNNFKELKVLDIGCFTGEFLEILKKRGADVYGIELQDDAVKIANKILGGRVYKANIIDNQFANMKFDIISLPFYVGEMTVLASKK